MQFHRPRNVAATSSLAVGGTMASEERSCHVNPYFILPLASALACLVFGVLIVAWLWHAPVPANERALQIAAGLLLILPLLAAALGHMTGLALGPLFIVPIFVVAVRMGLQRSM